MSWPKNFKKSFWSVFSCSTKQQTVSLSDCDKKWILYDSWWWPSQWLTEKLQSTSQSPRLAPKRSWSLFGGLLPVWSTTAFWIPVKPLHLRSMLSKLMRCTANCNTCSQLWSTERAQFFPMTIPNSMSHNQWFKVEQIGLSNFTSVAMFTWPLVNWLSFLQASWQLFVGKSLP